MDRPGNNVKAIFIAALDHEPGADRAAYLDAACGDNADLRRRVEALLAAHERADEVLGPAGEQSGESDTIDSNAGRPRAEATIAQSPEPGVLRLRPRSRPTIDGTAGPDVLIAGRYVLKEKIGEGGMGEVWVAKQTEPVKRKVALKLIKTGMDSRAVLARFEQERQALAMMDHPNIARVLDGGLTPSGQPFFVMELVNGLPLTKFCDEAKLTPKERLELFVPICQAVQHAHQKGIVHRDLEAGQHPGHAHRRQADPQGDRLWRGQGDRRQADRRVDVDAVWRGGRHAGVHVARTSGFFGRRYRHPGRHLFARRDSVRTVDGSSAHRCEATEEGRAHGDDPDHPGRSAVEAIDAALHR